MSNKNSLSGATRSGNGSFLGEAAAMPPLNAVLAKGRFGSCDTSVAGPHGCEQLYER